MIQRLTVKAYLTNFNGTYLALPFFAILTLIALANPEGGYFLYGLALLNASYFALLTGTTLTEIKVKPFSFCMPGQEKSLGPAIVTCAASISLLNALLLTLRPIPGIDGPVLLQAGGGFLWSLGLYLLIVTSTAYTRDSMINSLAVMLLFFMLMAALSNQAIDSAFRTIAASLAASPLAATAFAAASVVLTLRAFASRELSRNLCGAPFFPLKVYDNPAKLEDYRNRLRQTSFRPSAITASTGLPFGRLIVAISERLAGSSWDFMLHESRLSGSLNQMLTKLLYVATIVVFIALMIWREDGQPLVGLYYLVAMTLMFFPPIFRARLSPMLPVGRAQRLRSLLAKAAVVYVTTLVAIVALRWLFAALAPFVPVLGASAFGELIRLTPVGLIVLALNVPLLCFLFTAVRSTPAFLATFFIYMIAAVTGISIVDDWLLARTLLEVLLLTGVAWIPFLLIARKRVLHDDLLRL